MKKHNHITYWIFTIFLSFAMLAGGIQQTLQIGGYNKIVTALHYPLYMLSIIGVWKCLGVIAILIPGFPVLKEWAYAGFFFVLTGAAISHFASGEHLTAALPALILLAVTILSWYFRPANRKVQTVTP